MKIGYAMIKNNTDPIEDQILALQKEGCSMIYKDIITDHEDGSHGLRDLLDNLEKDSLVILENLNLIARSMEAPIGFFEVLIERKCALKLLETRRTFSKEEIVQQKENWLDLLKCRAKIKSRRVRNTFDTK